MRKAKSRVSAGFTLAEVAIATFIFTTAMVFVVGIYLGLHRITEGNRNLAQALNDARVVLEGIRDVSTGGLTAVTNTNWIHWAADPNGGNLTDPQFRTNPAPISSETVQVQYADVWDNPATPTADPLPVIVRVDWQERGRARSALVNTQVTRR